MQLVDVFQSVRRHWRVSLAILVLTGVCLGLFLFTRNETREPDRWRGAVQLLVPTRDKDGGLPEGVPPSLLQGQGVVALSEETRTDALQRAGMEDLRDRVTFDFKSEGDILILSATAPTSAGALKLADAFAGAYARQRRDTVAASKENSRIDDRGALEVLQTRLEVVDEELQAADPFIFALATASDARPASGDDGAPPPVVIPAGTPLDVVLLAYEHRYLIERIETTQREYAQTAIDTLLPRSHTTVVEREVPRQTTPGLPSPLIPILVAVTAGLLLAVLVPVAMDRVDHTIRDPRVAATALSAPVLSTIPASSAANLATLAAPGSARDSAYRRLAAASIATDELPRAIVVTSPVGQMQDSVAANFAAALAGLGLRVALVATEPSQSWYADPDEQAGALTFPDFLATAHAGQLNGHVRDGMMSTPFENLRVIPHGEASADALLDGLPPLLLAMAENDIDVTVIAAPAMLEESNATILAWSTRSVLWVVESGEVTEHEAHEAAERLALAGASPFGVAVVAGTS